MAIILKPQSQEPRQRLALVSAVSMLWAEVKTNAILSCDFHVVFYSRLLSDPRVEKKKKNFRKNFYFPFTLTFKGQLQARLRLGQCNVCAKDAALCQEESSGLLPLCAPFWTCMF